MRGDKRHQSERLCYQDATRNREKHTPSRERVEKGLRGGAGVGIMESCTERKLKQMFKMKLWTRSSKRVEMKDLCVTFCSLYIWSLLVYELSSDCIYLYGQGIYGLFYCTKVKPNASTNIFWTYFGPKKWPEECCLMKQILMQHFFREQKYTFN